MTAIRLKKGGYINREQTVSFYWNNKKYHGYQGDTLASAFLSNNINIIGRSFKYHRAEGYHVLRCRRIRIFGYNWSG